MCEKATITVRVDEARTTSEICLVKDVCYGDTVHASQHVFKTLDSDRRGVNVYGLYLNHLWLLRNIVLINKKLKTLKTLIEKLKSANSEWFRNKH